MSTTSKIEWTDKTWNPVRGCSVVSEGCRNCYAMKQAHRFSGEGMPYEGLTEIGSHGPRWTGKIQLVSDALDEPLRWKKPCRVFVNSMSDLFHEGVSDDFIKSVFVTMANAKHHTFQVLTKRPDRMMRLMTKWKATGVLLRSGYGAVLPNVWLGISVEDQETLEARVSHLLRTPATVRFLSAEPLLGPLDLRSYLPPMMGTGWVSPYRPVNYDGKPLIHWVIVGGESGPGARPCYLAWVRSIIHQCQQASVLCFVKQLGARPTQYVFQNIGTTPCGDIADDGRYEPIKLNDKKGGDMNEWPNDLQVREFPLPH